MTGPCGVCGSVTYRCDHTECARPQLSLFEERQHVPLSGNPVEAALRAAREREEARLRSLESLGRPVTVALVGCSKEKLPEKAPARDLYTSRLFQLSVRYAEQVADEAYVLSAFHGLVPLDDVLTPYDRSMTKMPMAEREAWVHRVVSALSIRYPDLQLSLLILAGARYAKPLTASCRIREWKVEEPLKGLLVGERLAWLHARLPKDHEVPSPRTRPRERRRVHGEGGAA